MIPLLRKSNLVHLEALSFTKSLYAFDFDGTLSRIVTVPANAKMSHRTTRLLRELSRLAPVAVISGRSIADLKRRLPLELPFIVGNHGLELPGDRRTSLRAAELECSKWKRKLLRVKWHDGIEIEDKKFSLAIHYRRTREKKMAKRQILQAISELRPIPKVLGGKCVYNLLPADAPHKGVALARLVRLAGAKSALYVGDDDTDEDVFDLPDAELAVTVRVGKKRTSNARYYIEKQSEINRLLELIIRFHRDQSKL